MSKMIVSFLSILVLSQNAFAFDQEHKAWTAWLSAYTREVPGPATQVNYPHARKNAASLNKYLNELSAVSEAEFHSWSMLQQKAFLINAYNAFTVKLILDNKPVESIKNLGSLLSTPWKIRFIPLLGKTLTLDEIEQERLRPVFKDPRIHFAVVCASIGCPRLQRKAFTVDSLGVQMDRATREFLLDVSRNRIQVQDGDTHLHLSKIFKWYAIDFGGERNVPGFVFHYVPLTPQQKDQALRQNVNIKYLDYDWRLNQYR